MMLSSYISRSRHGVYYFRWPIPPSLDGKRSTIRLSLRTKCPGRAGDLARYLTSCGRLPCENNALAGLRQSAIREKVQSFFKVHDRHQIPETAPHWQIGDIECRCRDRESQLDHSTLRVTLQALSFLANKVIGHSPTALARNSSTCSASMSGAFLPTRSNTSGALTGSIFFQL